MAIATVPKSARFPVEDVRTPREPDLESQRARAAMLVLGITPADLQVDLGGGGSDRRAEMLRRKRRELLAEVDEAAAGLPEDVAQRLLSPDPIAEARESGWSSGWASARKEAKSDNRLQALREQAKNEVIKIREAEENRLRRLKEGQEKDEAVRKRVEEMRVKEQEKRDAAVKVREATIEKQQLTLKAADQKKKEVNRELMQKLRKGFENGEEQQKTRAEHWMSARVERAEKFEVVLQRKERHDLDQQAEMADRYRDKQERTRRRQEDQRRHHQERADDGQAKFAERMEMLRRLADEQQAKREDEWSKTMDKLEKGKESVDLRIQERVSTSHAEMEKRTELHSARMRNIRKERRDKNKEILDKIQRNEGGHRAVNLRAEDTERMKEQRGAMQQLVVHNQNRLERALEFERKQRLARILKNKARVDGRKGQQEQFQQERRTLLKEFLIEKDLCREMVRTMKMPRDLEAAEAPAAEDK